MEVKMRPKNKEYTFCDEGLDTLMYLLEKEEMELCKKKLSSELNEIDQDFLISIKDCKRVINNIEKRAEKAKKSYLDNYAKKKTKVKTSKVKK